MPETTSAESLETSITSVAALADPVRRRLYRFVASQPDGAGREAAASNAGISRALAAFHLDRLVESGLLDTGFRRLGARSGPGAGRPAKIYRRAAREVNVTLPERHYDVAGELLAAALDGSAGSSDIAGSDVGAQERLDAEARALGASLGAEARKRAGSRPSRARLIEAATGLLAERGYEPVAAADGSIVLRNCPFDALAQRHRPVICAMNFSIIGGIVEGLRLHGIVTVLDPAPGRCCVTWGRQAS
jgi:predicted ArsR family transcriptional regulator